MSLTERRTGEPRGLSASGARSGAAIFAVDVELLPREAVLTLCGELDAWTKQILVGALDRVDENVARIVLDLSDLTFIDVSSLGFIHRARIRAAMRGTDLVLRSPSLHTLRLLSLTGLCEGAVTVEEIRPIGLQV